MPTVTLTPPTDWDRASLAGLWHVWQEDWRVNGRSPFVPGTQAMTIFRLGQWLDDPRRNALVRLVASGLYKTGAIYARFVLGLEFRKETKIGRRVEFAHQHGVVIDPHTEIGDEVLILHGVTIGLRLSVADAENPSLGAKIGARVTIGAGAKIIGAVRIGDDATIGPNAVVMTDVPARGSVVAAPSRVLRIRSDS